MIHIWCIANIGLYAGVIWLLALFTVGQSLNYIVYRLLCSFHNVVSIM